MLDAVGSAVAWCLGRISAYSALSFAVLLTGLFYYPSLRNGCRDAGFLYGGDVLGFYWPYVAKLQFLLSRHHFVALDFGQFDASADFFLAANFFACHPLFVLWSLGTSPETTTFQAAGRILVWALVLHSFIACYFTLRLLKRFFGFDFWSAAFSATAYAFSVYAINAHGEPMFVFCGSVLPWAAYAALDYAEGRGFRRLVLASFPVLVGYLAGYVPLGIACLGLAAVLVGVRIFLLPRSTPPLEVRASRYAAALLPFFMGTLVAIPYLAAVYFFLKASPSASSASLYFSAHQLAEVPQSILRALSYRAAIPGPFHEFSVTWGLIAIAVAAIFLLSSRTLDSLSRTEWTLLKVSGLIYFAIVLSIFGQYSVVSDMVFYFIPQVGGMHIYQRFLLPGQLLFGVMIALMLKAVIDARPVLGTRIACALFGSAAFAAAFFVLHHPASAGSIGISNYLVFELLLAALCMAALLVPDKTFAYVASLALFTLPALDVMYDRSQGGSTRDEQAKRHGVMLDEALRQGVVNYLARFRSQGKELIKYVDITPRWNTDGVESFPKAFPHFVLQDVSLCAYTGFNFYLSTRADYMATIPYQGDGRFHPQWERLRGSGADFIVCREADLPSVEPFTGTLTAADVHRLPGGIVLAPLWQEDAQKRRRDGQYDNGYFRIERDAGGEKAFEAAGNLALGKSARQSSEGGGPASRATDGNTSGVWGDGSVTHTADEAGAWLEIDLGTSQPIGSVRVWNRSEHAERLDDFTLTVSDQPFPNALPDQEESRKAAWNKRIATVPRPEFTIETPGAVGRFVRIQLNAKPPGADSILSLAEVQVFSPAASTTSAAVQSDARVPPFEVLSFSSNKANHLSLELNASEPLAVTYLMWDHPRLRYTLNGVPATVEQRQGRATIQVPPGVATIDITYHNRTLTFFWLVYAGYLLVAAWALVLRSLESLSPTMHGRFRPGVPTTPVRLTL